MADLRSTANDFRGTWEKEVDLEEEAKAFRIDNLLDDEPEEKPIPRESSILPETVDESRSVGVPAIKSMNKEEFEALTSATVETDDADGHHLEAEAKQDEPDLLSDKRNWL